MKRDDRGGTEVYVKITFEEGNRWSEIGAHVTIMERTLISEITRREEKKKGEEKRIDGGEEEKRRGSGGGEKEE